MVDERQYWLGFTLVSGVGPVRFRRLLDYFGSAAAAWQAPARDLALAGLDARTVEAIVAQRPLIDLDAQWKQLTAKNVRLLLLTDPEYPARLKEIHDPPPVLYVRGEILPQDELCLAVVGTRRCTPYGRQAVDRIVGGLARNGVTIVSGLARGVDTLAHRVALQAGGRTIAVLGSGVDVIYPVENSRLAEEIVAHGALVSEYPLGTKPEAGNFPARNRIISGLTPATLVIEAGKQSGALITADFALEQGRDVLSVPGSIFGPQSEGTNRLIREGATLITSAEDVLEALKVPEVAEQLTMRELLPVDETEAKLLTYISHEPRHIDEIGRASGLPMATVSATLTMMELKGLVRQVGTMQYVSGR